MVYLVIPVQSYGVEDRCCLYSSVGTTEKSLPNVHGEDAFNGFPVDLITIQNLLYLISSDSVIWSISFLIFSSQIFLSTDRVNVYALAPVLISQQTNLCIGLLVS